MDKQKKTEGITSIDLLKKDFTVHDSKIIKQMISYVEDNYGIRFAFQDLVNEVGYSSTLLQNHVKKYMNTTFNDYVNRYRIQ